LVSGEIVHRFVFVNVLAAGFLSAFCLGFVAHRDGRLGALLNRAFRPGVDAAPTSSPQRPAGEWYPFSPRADADVSAADREMLAAIGYSGASAAGASTSGVTLYDAQRAQPGLNLYISGHAPEAILADMQGAVRHRWAVDFEDLWPGYEPPPYVRITGHQYWRRVHAYPNGDLLALHEGIGLVKLDKNSNVLWKRRDNFHHDFAVTDDGRIYALNRTMGPIVAPPGGEPFLMEPVLSVLGADGEELQRIPLIACFENSTYAPMLARMPESGDRFHENSVQIFDGSLADRSPLFAKGNVLISIWTLDALAIVDLQRERVVWAMTGMWRRQHESQLLPTGNMLVFDNRGNRGNSRILEFDPFTQEVLWSYSPDRPEDFHSEWCGGLQRLANGNTLITETNNGRAFEATPNSDIVWEFVNPHQVAHGGGNMIASLWKVTRLPESFGADWLEPADGR
jgi:hypothetical protein